MAVDVELRGVFELRAGEARLAFELVPNTLDTAIGTFAAWNMFFFFTAAMLFINVHHYFIDNVLWRFKDPEIRAYLLS